MKKIPYGKQFIDKRDMYAVKKSLSETTLKNSIDSLKRTQIIPIVVSIVTRAVAFKISSINFSFIFLIDEYDLF